MPLLLPLAVVISIAEAAALGWIAARRPGRRIYRISVVHPDGNEIDVQAPTSREASAMLACTAPGPAASGGMTADQIQAAIAAATAASETRMRAAILMAVAMTTEQPDAPPAAPDPAAPPGLEDFYMTPAGQAVRDRIKELETEIADLVSTAVAAALADAKTESDAALAKLQADHDADIADLNTELDTLKTQLDGLQPKPAAPAGGTADEGAAAGKVAAEPIATNVTNNADGTVTTTFGDGSTITADANGTPLSQTPATSAG